MRDFFLGCGVVCILSGCASPQSRVLGHAPPPGRVTPVSSLRPSASPVTVHGLMVEKCPISGCWFKLRDASGVVRVDTKSSGFVVADVPVNSEMTVTGTFQMTSGRQIVASGLRY